MCTGASPSYTVEGSVQALWVDQLDSSTDSWELVENMIVKPKRSPLLHLLRNMVTAQILKDQNLIPCLELPSKVEHSLLVVSQLEELGYGARDALYPDPEFGFRAVSAGSRIGRAVWAGRKCRGPTQSNTRCVAISSF